MILPSSKRDSVAYHLPYCYFWQVAGVQQAQAAVSGKNMQES